MSTPVTPVTVCQKAGDIFFSLTFPERIAARKLKETAKEYRCATLVIMAAAASIFGLLKVITIPMELCSGCLSLPMRAAIDGLKNQSMQAALPAMLAWVFCLLTVATIISAIIAAAFVPPAAVFFSIGIIVASVSAISFFAMHNEISEATSPMPAYEREVNYEILRKAYLS